MSEHAITLLEVDMEGFEVACVQDLGHLMVELYEAGIDYIYEHPDCGIILPYYKIYDGVET